MYLHCKEKLTYTLNPFSATSEGGSESIPSPFPSSGFGIGGSFPHRVKRRPKFFNGDLLDKTTAHDLLFAMKPPPCIVSLRKRIRNFPRKCRQPHSNIVVAAFLLKIEAEAVKVRPPRRRIIADKKRQELRIENLVAKMTNRAKHVTKKPVINIQSWKSTTTTSQPATTSSKSSTAKINFSNKNLGLAPAPAVTTMRVKSELCPVTETCTAATLPPPSSPSTHAKSSKSKVDSRNVCSTTTSTKTLPITPTIARIKHEPANPIQISQNVTSFMSPDMQRVKVEIGRQYSPTHHMPPTSTSPMNDFASPRKRYLQDFDALSPASKRHRLSTDSRGSAGSEGTTTGMSSNGGNGSPHHFMHPGSVASPPRQAQNNGHRMSSFSIDSIISGSSRDDRVDNGSSAHVSSPKPIKPVPVTPRRSPVTSQPSSQQQQPTTPLVHITPYASRGIDPRTPIDPRLAHLAGVAADPRLGLSPVAASFGYANPYSNFFASHFAANSPFAQLAAATQFAQLAAASGLMRPLPEPSPSLTGSPAPPARTLSLSSANTMTSVQSPSPTPPPVSTAQPTSSFSTWGQQYRGEPRVEAPSKSESRRSDQPMDTGGGRYLDLFLNGIGDNFSDKSIPAILRQFGVFKEVSQFMQNCNR